MNDSSAGRPNRFLADLAHAMRSTAEAERLAMIDQCRSKAKAYTEYLLAQTDGEAPSLHQAAEADVGAIRDWSKAEMERIRVETEQRISRRRELLEQELQEYSSAIELEIERAQNRVSAFEQEVAQFFEQLGQESDPTVFASVAAQIPDPPEFAEPSPTALVSELRGRRDQATPVEAASEATPETEAALPDHWWLDSPTTPGGEDPVDVSAGRA